MTSRTFETGAARRERTPIAIGIIGPSGSGKTKSALRLADGMARVGGGPTFLVDTNNRRSLHHAPEHAFTVVHMPPPYSPDDYGQAFAKAIADGARRIIVDSISDEWEGAGGVLDMQAAELERKGGGDNHKMSSWIGPKREHNKLKLWMFQQPVDWILTFRAKEKIKPVKGGQPEDLGWQPLGADDLIYELLIKCLLRPQCDGTPVWSSEVLHERALIKLPGWFRDLFTKGRQLDEDIGEQLARWAAGGEAGPARAATPPPASAPRVPASGGVEPHPLAARFDACTRETFLALDGEMRRDWKSIAIEQRPAVTAAFERAQARLKGS